MPSIGTTQPGNQSLACTVHGPIASTTWSALSSSNPSSPFLSPSSLSTELVIHHPIATQIKQVVSVESTAPQRSSLASDPFTSAYPSLPPSLPARRASKTKQRRSKDKVRKASQLDAVVQASDPSTDRTQDLIKCVRFVSQVEQWLFVPAQAHTQVVPQHGGYSLGLSWSVEPEARRTVLRDHTNLSPGKFGSCSVSSPSKGKQKRDEEDTVKKTMNRKQDRWRTIHKIKKTQSP